MNSKCWWGFHWALMSVYGAAQDEYKGAFLSELVRICSDEELQLVVGVTLILFVIHQKRVMVILIVVGLIYSMPQLMS